MSFTCPHNMVNFGPLTAEIGWRVWGTPANFNGFRVLASLMHRRLSTMVNQILHDVWPIPGLVHYIHCWVLLSRNGILPGAKFILRPSLAFSDSPILSALQCTTLEQWAWSKLCGVVQAMELRNFCSSSFATEGATYIPRAAITLGIGHILVCIWCALSLHSDSHSRHSSSTSISVLSALDVFKIMRYT